MSQLNFTQTATNLGTLDGVDASNTIFGWACQQGSDESINVDLYAGGPWNTGQWLGRIVADQSSEPEVAAACGSRGQKLRFSFALDADAVKRVSGKAIYAYAVPNDDSTPALLSNSGQLNVPVTQ